MLLNTVLQTITFSELCITPTLSFVGLKQVQTQSNWGGGRTKTEQ